MCIFECFSVFVRNSSAQMACKKTLQVCANVPMATLGCSTPLATPGLESKVFQRVAGSDETGLSHH